MCLSLLPPAAQVGFIVSIVQMGKLRPRHSRNIICWVPLTLHISFTAFVIWACEHSRSCLPTPHSRGLNLNWSSGYHSTLRWGFMHTGPLSLLFGELHPISLLPEVSGSFQKLQRLSLHAASAQLALHMRPPQEAGLFDHSNTNSRV